ncbi:MAG: sodium:proton antiporter [Planctomycetia bacterium]
MSLLPLLASGSIPLLAVLPFVLLLLGIAVLPLVAHHWWESNRSRAIVSLGLALPVAGWLLVGPEHGAHWLAHSLVEYVAFLALLGSLFVITGGIYLRGSLAGSPGVNTAILAVGAVLASFIGTTGASMLLIRPLLRANERRERKTHIVVFFIFIVSNAGGMLTPLGDPPLFLGFLKGVPFAWTFGLAYEWAIVCSVLLAVFYAWDRAAMRREAPGASDPMGLREPLALEGKVNLLWLLGVIGVILGVGTLGSAWSDAAKAGVQAGGMLLFAVLSLRSTPQAIRVANRFGYGPIVEVAVIFAGIFVTMVPALHLLEGMGKDGTIALHHPWQYFWATGALSSFLDNAPTYLVFASLAKGMLGIEADSLKALVDAGATATMPAGDILLKAISCGAVFMGANTYIGNGPNFMVKAIAEENKVKMPSFFGYMLWSVGILIPIFLVLTFVFFGN